jgi:translation initiation factor IF-2
LAKNLKLNIKNAQLAEALKIGKVAPKAKEKPKATNIPAASEQPSLELANQNVPVTDTPPVQESSSFLEEARHVKAQSQSAKFEPKAKPQDRSELFKDVPETVHQADRDSSSKSVENTSSAPLNQPPSRPTYTPQQNRFKPAESSYTPREGGFKPREGGYTPREGGFKPREGGYTPREGGFKPREGGYTPREGGFKPREGGYTPREGGFRPAPGFQKSDSSSAPLVKRAPGSSFTAGFRPAPAALPNTEKKTPSRVLDQEMSAKPKKVFSKDQKEVPTKRKIDEKRSFNTQDRLGLRNDDQGSWRKKRSFKQKAASQDEAEIIRPKKLDVSIPITVKDLAAMMKLKASELVAKLFMQGVMITLNDFLEDETTIQLLGHEFDCEITIDRKEEDRLKITDKTIKEEIQDSPEENLVLRAPVVAFMGHVDHGKTSLVDAIRKSNIVAGEAGAITQHIGAFQCHTSHGLITILDTPGHEAFNEMRARGADITDIVVLVIAGDEGIKPQTMEALSQARAALCPVVVAITKSDKPNFNLETIYRQLADQELLPEAWGGTTIAVPCSSVTKQGLDTLLEMLALQSEILELKSDPKARARGTVIESQMHKGLGAVTTLLIQNGTLKLGDAVVIGEHFARIKTMMNDHGAQISEAGPSTPVKITGLSGLPLAGSEFIVVKNEKEAKELSEKRALGSRQLAMQTKRGSIESMLAKSQEGVKKYLPLILKADVQGSLEALKTSLLKIPSEKVELIFISSSVGEITESDVSLAAASKAAIVGFHTHIESHAEPLIKEKNIKIVMEDVIYHVVDALKLLMKAQLDKIAKEEPSGKALIKAVFKASSLGLIAGCQVIEGSIKRSNQVRIHRGEEVIWKGTISSLKKVKEDVKEVSKGHECGIVLQGFSEIKEEDIIEGYEIIYLEQEL